MRKKSLLFLLLTCFIVSAADETYLHFAPKDGPGKAKHIVFIAGDEEYRSEESLPMLVKILSQRHGFEATVLFSMDPTGSYIDPNNQKSITHPEMIGKAD